MTKRSSTRPLPGRALRCLGLLLGCAASASLLSQTAHGQSSRSFQNEIEDMYQVELIIFAQGGDPEDGDEIWRTNIELSYPMDWLELVSPAELAAAAREESQSTDLGDLGLNTEGDNGFDNGFNLDQSFETQGETGRDSSDTGREFTRDVDDEVVDPSQGVGERALLLLPEDALTLRDQARRLSRNSNYRVLFHGAWRQPLKEGSREPSIIIAGGEQFDEHHELEGSINLNRRTYLHIETDLWLAHFAPNFGQERRPWPALPWPPNRQPETSSMIRLDDGGTGLWHQFDRDRDKEVEAILAQPYVVENVVLMQQERRMRSNELHYIDHPKVGLLIKLTPYEPSEDDENESR